MIAQLKQITLLEYLLMLGAGAGAGAGFGVWVIHIQDSMDMRS
jgi:hypothetical protein